jgi:hypothetical protein
MTSDQLKTSIEQIRNAMDVKVGLEDPVGIVTKLEALSSMAGLSAECIAWARKFYDTRLGLMLRSRDYQNYTPAEKKILFAADASNEIFMVNYAESLNKDLHYNIESLRTMISYVKQDLQSNFNQR